MAITDPVQWRMPDHVPDDVAMQLGLPVVYVNHQFRGCDSVFFVVVLGVFAWRAYAGATDSSFQYHWQMWLLLVVLVLIILMLLEFMFFPWRTVVHTRGISIAGVPWLKRFVPWPYVRSVCYRYSEDKSFNTIWLRFGRSMDVWLVIATPDSALMIAAVSTDIGFRTGFEKPEDITRPELEPLRQVIQSVLDYFESLNPNKPPDSFAVDEIGV